MSRASLIASSVREEPEWIDEDKAAPIRKQMEDDGVIYGGSRSYRRMCRFFSGMF
jgi:hypothetical protein